MKKQVIFGSLVLVSSLVLTGCVARTYPLTRDRIDQDLSSGNRGYLAGNAPAESNLERKTERTVRVFEIELGSPAKGKNKACDTQTPNLGYGTGENSIDTAYSAGSTTTGAFQKYTVAKNDTLQKISQKFYGTSKKWMQIYEANKDVLKGPNKVYPGQVLNIPELPGNTIEQGLSEPKENLK